ncbi:sulfide:quinone oxidoreductase, mitochondrial isoform X1 [Toxorhynchites rutilus septentrionalis]|uniref:sulfide:quinone oxidoreductase, mitochondrial isoform X1 n=2 Tax=Toxorhynchites rutilus septentrionalis TaxID=329112 RepID=UPI00247887B4|nr:sulfide:quinone oxidoreductase, mitochondrial isoform X1 [Toxorhynchites rutilus septentrionalis]
MNAVRIQVVLRSGVHNSIRAFGTTSVTNDIHRCKVLVVGGGAGGCSVAAKLSSKLGQGKVIILEPSERHYYQPMFTLIGGGIKSLEDSFRPMSKVLPALAKWLKDSAAKFEPEKNTVLTANGDKIEYEFLLVAMGLQLNYDKIPGLVDALAIPKGKVCSNYSPKYVNRTFEALKAFRTGNAIFTFPNSPVKCPGAPQKILYIAEHYMRKSKKRQNANMVYNTSLPVLFGVKHYADALWKVVEGRNIKVNLRTTLVEVYPERNQALFQNLDKPEETFTTDYEFLHVTPPMSAPDVLKSCEPLVTETGFVDVNKDTLQHVRFENVFAIGDCSASPNSKTAASVAAQSQVVYKNMVSVMNGHKPTRVFDGYASCPLVTGYNSCILAEFDYNLNPLETFPVDQSKERYSMFLMKKDVMPPLYWHLLLNGLWNGPGLARKLMHFKL